MNANLPYPASAFAPLEDFPLLWRWTSRTHAVFPPDVLKLIHPFTSSAALNISAEASTRVPLPHLASDVSMACGESAPGEDVMGWLLELGARSSAWTVLSWSNELAALVPWDVFATRWSDFCYPSSDDVHIWQPGQEWTLAYEHDESFRLFRHRAARVV